MERKTKAKAKAKPVELSPGENARMIVLKPRTWGRLNKEVSLTTTQGAIIEKALALYWNLKDALKDS